jgi:hydroxymethylbilane synthase
VVTEGDRRRDVPAASLGGKGIFTAAVQQAVLDGRADLAVPLGQGPARRPGPRPWSWPPCPGATTPATSLVGRSRLTGLDDLGPGPGSAPAAHAGSRCCTGSGPTWSWSRSAATSTAGSAAVHGGELDAVVLAAAGLRRLGLAERRPVPARPGGVHPGPGQGTLAVEAREDDTRALGLLSALTHRPSRVALRAERSFLRRLGGSCTLPAGALAAPTDAGPLEIQGFLSGLDGKGLVRERLRGPADDPEGLGRASPTASWTPAAPRSAPWSRTAAVDHGRGPWPG